MDLNTLNLSEGADIGNTMEVKHPVTDEVLLDDNKKPVTITLLGSDSTVLRDAMKNRARKQLRTKKSQSFDVDEAEKIGCEMLATCTVGWSGISENGSSVQFSHEAATDLYLKYQWLRQQVDEFINDRENFFKA